jgi:hypothetical protein
MLKKIPRRNLQIFHTRLSRSLKGSTIIPLQWREKEETHLAFIARREVTMKNTVEKCIQKRNRNSSVERGRQRLLLQCNKILVSNQEMKERSQRKE